MDSLNPFNWHGPEFLLLYAVLLATAVAAAMWIRAAAAGAGISKRTTPLDLYEAAFLAGGHARLAVTTAAALLNRGWVALNPNGSLVVTEAGRQEIDRAHMVERPILAHPTEIRRGDWELLLAAPEKAIEQSFKSSGLVMSDATISTTRIWIAAIFGTLLAIGGIKVLVGLHRNKPVEILFVMMAVAVFVVILLLFLGLRHTRDGQKLISLMQNQFDRRRPAAGSTAAVPLAVIALWGTQGVGQHPFQSYLTGLEGSARDGGGSDGGSSGSSCGGGDGGGGGGCGGCGGGGGD